MDFDSDFFDLAFDDTTLPDAEQNQPRAQSAVKTAPSLDFQDFCNEFAKNGYEDLGTVPEWTAPAGQPRQQDAHASNKGDLDRKDSFEGLGTLENLFSFNFGSDAQVVPDMAAGTSGLPDFSLPTVSHPPTARQAQTAGFGTDPYSWVQGFGGMPFGYPARPRPNDPEARQQSLNRYRDKKARRFHNSTKVRYEMRKVNADKRPRIKGRFVKPEELQRHLEGALASSIST